MSLRILKADDSILRAADRLCIFSHHHPQGRAPAYVLHHLQEIRDAGFRVAFVSAGELLAAAAAALAPLCDLIATRENVGFDFGTWRAAFTHLGDIQADLLLLTNDSVYGPFAPLPAYLDRLTATPADAWGAIESSAFGRHLQSWFLLLTPAAYRSAAFRDLLADPIDPALSKWGLVQRYELGLSRRLLEEGLRLRGGYVAEAHGALARLHSYNPCGVLWRELAQGPVPYVKASVLRTNPTLSAGVRDWRRVLGRLDPTLAALVAQDLAARDAHPPTAFLERWRASLHRPQPVDWPEVQAVLRADHHARPGSAVRSFGGIAFRAVRRFGAVSRRAAV